MQLRLAEIDSLGATLVAVSPELPDQTLSLKEKINLEFPVLSDAGNKVARKYGLVFTLPEILRPVYTGFGINIPASNGDDSFELPVPATYVIDRDSRIVLDFVEVNHTQRLEPDAIIKALQALSA